MPKGTCIGAGAGSGGGWTPISGGKYDASPASSSRISMSDTSDFNVGDPVSVQQGGVWRYFQVVAISDDVHIDLAGEGMTGEDIEQLSRAPAGELLTLPLFVNALYGDNVIADLLFTDMNWAEIWTNPPARLVRVRAWNKTGETGAVKPAINVVIDSGAAVEALSADLSMGGDDVVVNSPNDGVDGANNQINYGDRLRIPIKVAGTNGDAANLAVYAVFVMERD
jgi:hypothetical protein